MGDIMVSFVAFIAALVGVVLMPKQPRSFSVDEEIIETLQRRDDVNASGAVNQFLKQYLAADRGEEAALEVRINQLDEKIADKRQELDRLERERERIQNRLESRRSELDDVLDTVKDKIEAGEFPTENIDSENPAIQKWAAEAGVPSHQLVEELEVWV